MHLKEDFFKCKLKFNYKTKYSSSICLLKIKLNYLYWFGSPCIYIANSTDIAKWNGMAPRDVLKLGQKLVIWQKNKITQASLTSATSFVPVEHAIMRNITYKVRRGDSFARIADKFNVSIKDIEQWNNLKRKKYLQPGQRLKLSVDVTNSI